jgi:hypothetical protein
MKHSSPSRLTLLNVDQSNHHRRPQNRKLTNAEYIVGAVQSLRASLSDYAAQVNNLYQFNDLNAVDVVVALSERGRISNCSELKEYYRCMHEKLNESFVSAIVITSGKCVSTTI